MTCFNMATISMSKENFVITCGNVLLSYQFGYTEGFQTLTCEKPQEREKNEEEPSKNKDGDESNKILTSGISPSGKFLVACDDYKLVWIWTKVCSEGTKWELHSKRDLGRRSTSLTFPKDEQNVLIADKSGDVLSFSLTDAKAEGQLLMGHVSMLLDLTLCGKDDNFLVTCDRDEKLRVSHYPNAYNIQAYCLGHTEFVSRLAYFEEEDLLISGGGDLSLRIWNYKAGKEIFRLELDQDKDIIDQSSNGNTHNSTNPPSEHSKSEEDKCPLMSRREGVADVMCMTCCQKTKYLAVAFDKLKILLLYKLDTSDPSKPQLVKKQKLNLAGQHVLDISFDQWDNLWYLETTLGNTAHIMSYHQSEDLYKPLEKSSELSKVSENLLSMLEDINTNQEELFKAAFDIESSFTLLHKVRVDNITGYMERKQQRIEEKIQKRKGKKESDSLFESDDKKVKPS